MREGACILLTEKYCIDVSLDTFIVALDNLVALDNSIDKFFQFALGIVVNERELELAIKLPF